MVDLGPLGHPQSQIHSSVALRNTMTPSMPRKVNKPLSGLGMDYVAKILMDDKRDRF